MPEHQVARAQQLADARGGAAVDLARLFPALAQLLLVEHRLQSLALDDADRVDRGEIRDQHLRQPLAQRRELGVLAGVVEVEHADRRPGVAGAACGASAAGPAPATPSPTAAASAIAAAATSTRARALPAPLPIMRPHAASPRACCQRAPASARSGARRP